MLLFVGGTAPLEDQVCSWPGDPPALWPPVARLAGQEGGGGVCSSLAPGGSVGVPGAQGRGDACFSTVLHVKVCDPAQRGENAEGCQPAARRSSLLYKASSLLGRGLPAGAGRGARRAVSVLHHRWGPRGTGPSPARPSGKHSARRCLHSGNSMKRLWLAERKIVERKPNQLPTRVGDKSPDLHQPHSREADRPEAPNRLLK